MGGGYNYWCIFVVFISWIFCHQERAEFYWVDSPGNADFTFNIWYYSGRL